jgi:hypothetical protein
MKRRRFLKLADGAYYLAGYAVECGLKACIAKETKRYEFADKKRVFSSYSHKLQDLVKVAGLEQALAGVVRTSPKFRTNWQVAESSSEQAGRKRQGYRADGALAGSEVAPR